MTKIKIMKIEYINEYPEDDQYDPELKIKVQLQNRLIVELCTPNLNRGESLVKCGFLKEGKTVDVPVKYLSEGSICIEEEFEIKKAQELYKKSINKSKNTFNKLAIEKID